jgi:hypothetical protein
MEFRLMYCGPLLSNGGPELKQRLRREFHKQLRELWITHPDLSELTKNYFVYSGTRPYPPDTKRVMPAAADQEGAKTWLEHIADEYCRCGYRFVPLVRRNNGLTCALNILFLRHDGPGGLVANRGVIDNRIKILLDGLRMPEAVSELGPYGRAESEEDPFYCLLEDDRLITSLSVTTDRLLIPLAEDEKSYHVRLLIQVTIQNPSQIFAGDRFV